MDRKSRLTCRHITNHVSHQRFETESPILDVNDKKPLIDNFFVKFKAWDEKREKKDFRPLFRPVQMLYRISVVAMPERRVFMTNNCDRKLIRAISEWVWQEVHLYSLLLALVTKIVLQARKTGGGKHHQRDKLMLLQWEGSSLSEAGLSTDDIWWAKQRRERVLFCGLW